MLSTGYIGTFAITYALDSIILTFIQLGPSGLQSMFCFYLSDGYQSVLLLIIIVLI